MTKLKIRTVTSDELIRRIERNDDLENYRVIGRYNHLNDFWIKKIDESKIKDLETGVIIEIL